MRSPAAAIAWELRQRHRWGFIAVAAYLCSLAVARLLVPDPRADVESATTFAIAGVVPLFAAVMYFIALFTFGLDGDFAARQSIYPSRMFTLPVTTSALVAWPMLYGAAAMVILWTVARLLTVLPAGVDVPMFWPLVFGPALIAWAQALTWMPYPLPGLRAGMIVLWLTVVDAVVLAAIELEASEGVMIAILAPQVPLAYFVARVALARARRGEGQEGSDRRPATRGAALKEFASPSRAQVWLEWRQHGRSLPWLVAILLPFELALLFPFHEVPVIVFEVLVLVLLTPPFMAIFVAAHAGSVSPFLATRPMTDAALIGAKLKASIRSTLVTWLLVLAAAPVALHLSDATPRVVDFAEKVVEIFGVPRAIAIAVLLFTALVGSTWKQLVQSLYIGMTGREWLVKTSVFGALSLLAIALPAAQWVFSNRRLIAALWHALPWILAGLVVVKLCAAARVATRLEGVVTDRTLVVGAASWAVMVFAVFAVLRWIVPEILMASYILALIAILAVPLARVSAAPLALAWSRHR